MGSREQEVEAEDEPDPVDKELLLAKIMRVLQSNESVLKVSTNLTKALNDVI